MNRWFQCVSGMSVVLTLGCGEKATTADNPLGLETAPIVNGQAETGYAPVGALTQWYGNQYAGAFCTATVIRPEWLLTAAHCLEDSQVSQTRFFVGNDANNPNSGTFYRSLEFKIHAQYNPNSLENDIALVRLQTPVTGVTPIPYSVANLVPYEGDEAFYVGFGATEGYQESGGGLKRSTSFPISNVYAKAFDSDYTGTGTCFGDSGGPALLTINGALAVVGVTSAGAAPNGGGDPCQTTTFSTRVDAYGTWIAGKLNEPAPDCQDNASICSCAEACQANGACDDSVCQIETCSDSYDCLVNCGSDQGCQEQCYTNSSAAAQNQLDALFRCLETNCDPNAGDAAYQQCASSKCGDETRACFGGGTVSTGNDTCSQIYDCFAGCQDEACYTACYGDGTAAAQGQIDAMYGCFDTNCGTIQDENAWVACAQDKCDTQISACLGAPESCTLTGGSCDAGAACYPTTTEGFNGCFDTAGKAVGAPCNASATDLECVDGSACVEGEAGGVCARFCTSNAACGGGTCDMEIGVPGVGLCGAAGDVPCTDIDRDGACQADDCNDNDAGVHPGAAEACGNSKDDNCNGQTDEGCNANCTDSDGDGYCAEVDCNDNDAGVNSAAAERCGDATDNNCNGQTDEACDSCTDGDGDGYCATSGDCNDANVNVHPTIVETCGDGIDNNCSGQVDENCVPQGGNSSSGCAGGNEALPMFAALLGLGLVALRRRRVV